MLRLSAMSLVGDLGTDVLRTTRINKGFLGARGLSIEREHPGVGTIRLVGPSRRLSAMPPVPTRASGEPGHDTAAVLAMVGRGSEVAALVEREVVLERLPDDAAMVGRFR